MKSHDFSASEHFHKADIFDAVQLVVVQVSCICFALYKTLKMITHCSRNIWMKTSPCTSKKMCRLIKKGFHIRVFHISSIWEWKFLKSWILQLSCPGETLKIGIRHYKHVSSITLKSMCTRHSKETFKQDEMERLLEGFFVFFLMNDFWLIFLFYF